MMIRIYIILYFFRICNLQFYKKSIISQVTFVTLALFAYAMAYPQYLEPQYQASEHVQHYEGFQGGQAEERAFGGHHHIQQQQQQHHDEDEHVDYYVSRRNFRKSLKLNGAIKSHTSHRS